MGILTLRPATAEDAAPVARVFITARTQCLPFLNWSYDEAFMTALFANRVSGPETFLAAEMDGGVVGFIRFSPDEVDDLYILPAFHGRGIGKALLNEAKRRASAELRLWVFQANVPARAFYEGQGFEMEFETDGQGNMEKCPDARFLWRRPILSS